MAADVNSHGKIDCSDIAIVKVSMGKSAGQTVSIPAPTSTTTAWSTSSIWQLSRRS
jgi:hypothetical protein